MNILLTGANGYIGKRLIPVLLEKGHHITACVRDKNRFVYEGIYSQNLTLLQIDFLDDQLLVPLPDEIDVAFYLIHSMSSSIKDFTHLEAMAAEHFVTLINQTKARQIIYLSGLSNADELSKHLASRKNVEEILAASKIPLTTLRAGIIVGSGSASFEIIRDLVEKLPVMVAPKWLNTRCQPIAIRNVIEYLSGVIMKEGTFGRAFDIGGPDILTYKEMLKQFAEVRKFRRFILTVPVMSPRISSYWLYFITSTSYNLAVNLVSSMKIEVVCENDHIRQWVNIPLIDYKAAIKLAFEKIEQNLVTSSWKDAMVAGSNPFSLERFIEVPGYGCFKDIQKMIIQNDPEQVLENIWSIGGKRGWYFANALWKFRGSLDKVFGGVGLRRGRTNLSKIETGDVLDFWRVILADKKNKRLLLFAEMKLPGEAWLEFRITNKEGKDWLEQIATFRPRGIMGRLYWYLLFPAHVIIFKGMIKKIEKFNPYHS